MKDLLDQPLTTQVFKRCLSVCLSLCPEAQTRGRGRETQWGPVGEEDPVGQWACVHWKCATVGVRALLPGRVLPRFLRFAPFWAGFAAFSHFLAFSRFFSFSKLPGARRLHCAAVLAVIIRGLTHSRR